MKTSLKTGFAQIFSCCPKNLSCPKFGGAAAPLAPPGPYAYGKEDPPDKIINKFGAYDRGTMSVHYFLVIDRQV